jgi:hypothetical protein
MTARELVAMGLVPANRITPMPQMGLLAFKIIAKSIRLVLPEFAEEEQTETAVTGKVAPWTAAMNRLMLACMLRTTACATMLIIVTGLRHAHLVIRPAMQVPVVWREHPLAWQDAMNSLIPVCVRMIHSAQTISHFATGPNPAI